MEKTPEGGKVTREPHSGRGCGGTCSSWRFLILEGEGVEAKSERWLGGKTHTSLSENSKASVGG